MNTAPPTRHLLRAKDLIDARYRDRLDVPVLARAAYLSPAHFSREFRRAFGETPHQYLLTRRLERAAALLQNTDRSVADICFTVGLRSVGSFTTSFRRVYGLSPTAYRAAHPPRERARIPTCVLEDVTVPEMGNFRWLSVGVPGQDVSITLMAIPGPPVFDEETRDQIQKLLAKGASGGLFFSTDDAQKTYFYDLVFVFAITQVTSLLAHNPTWGGVLRGMYERDTAGTKAPQEAGIAGRRLIARTRS